jgi:hypothetical protein
MYIEKKCIVTSVSDVLVGEPDVVLVVWDDTTAYNFGVKYASQKCSTTNKTHQEPQLVRGPKGPTQHPNKTVFYPVAYAV